MIRVVAAAVVRDGRVLAARRRRPAHLAGGWEFPGGKVEPGEDDPVALARECREELGVDVAVGTRLAETSDDTIVLVLYAAGCTGEPTAGADHDALRWLAGHELDEPAWLPVDRAVTGSVRALLR